MTKSNYTGLEKLYEEFKDQGLEIFGFPCNQFGAQEPKSEFEIKNFVSSTYGASFKFFSKIAVNGEETHPIFKILKNNCGQMKEKDGSLKNIEWNFGKFLVNSEGEVVDFFDPLVKMEVIAEIIKEKL